MVKGKARAAGSFLGGLANNPAVVIIALVLGGLFIFRDRISAAVGGLGEAIGGGLGDINIQLPEIKLPEINFPEFNFPEIQFPDFASLFENFFNQQNDLLSSLAGQTVGDITIPPDTMVNPDGTVTSSTPPTSSGGGATQEQQDFAQARAAAFDTLFNVDVLTGTQIQEAISNIEFGDFAALSALVTSILSLANFPEDQSGGGGGFVVPASDPTGLGGGGSFIGGTTTFGDQTNIVDTLSEVLAIFPDLSASQAANALFANPDLTANEFAQITPFQPSISSAGGDPDQIINNASGGFSGLTPEQIAFILTGGNISNF